MRVPTTTRCDVESLVGVAEWYQQLEKDSNEAFMPLYLDTHRYLVLKGGGGSGKSIFAGRKILERAISERRHRFLVCRKVARTIKQSCYQQLREQIAAAYPDVITQVNQSDLSITFPHNNSKILFAGLDKMRCPV